MPEHRNYSISDLASVQGMTLGFSEEEVLYMARKSAVYNHPKVNRRFEEYYFVVEKDHILEMYSKEVLNVL